MRTRTSVVARAGGVLGLAAVLALGAAVPADAALLIRLTEGASSVTVADQGAGDANPVVGAVTFIGDVGVFDINVSTGLSKPVLANTPGRATMDLNSVNTSFSQAPATLVIELTDTDFLPSPAGTLHGMVGGTTQGTASFAACKNDSNVEFDMTGCEAEVALGPFGPGAFSGSADDSHGAILNPYSMTILASITHAAGQGVVSSFDFELTNVPEPATLALFGVGLLGAGIASRRRKAAQVA